MSWAALRSIKKGKEKNVGEVYAQRMFSLRNVWTYQSHYWFFPLVEMCVDMYMLVYTCITYFSLSSYPQGCQWVLMYIGEGNGRPLQCSCLGNPVDREPGGLLSIGSHRVRHDWSDLACMHALEKGMATHSSILAWRIPGTEEPGGLPSVGSHRVGHDWSDLAAAAYVY